jgi:hypothetical protein
MPVYPIFRHARHGTAIVPSMAVVDVEWSSHHHEWDSKNHGSLFIPFFNPNGIPCFWMNRYPIQKGKKNLQYSNMAVENQPWMAVGKINHL